MTLDVLREALKTAGPDEFIEIKNRIKEGGNKIYGLLRELSHDNDVGVAHRTVICLGQFHDPSLATDFVQLCLDPRHLVRNMAAIGLAGTGMPKLGEFVRRCCEGLPERNQASIIDALSYAPDPAVRDWLFEMLTKASTNALKYSAAMVLAELKVTEAIPLLLELLSTESEFRGRIAWATCLARMMDLTCPRSEADVARILDRVRDAGLG